MKRLWGGPLVVLSLLLGGVNGQEPEVRSAPQERAASTDDSRPRRQRNSIEQAIPPAAGKSVSIQLLLLEMDKEGKQLPKLDLSNAATLDTQVRTLEEAGEASVIYRVRMSSLEHLPCSLQVGGMRPMAVGRTMFGGRREGGPAGGNISYQLTELGTQFQWTPRVEEDGAVLVNLQVSSSRLVPMPKSDGESDPSAQQRIASLNTQATVRIPKDQATIVSAAQSAAAEESRELLILISAQVESSHLGVEASDEKQAAPQDEAQVLKIYSLRNANAEEMAKLIQRVVVDFPLRVAADVRTNALVIQTPADKSDEITALIERLDVPVTLTTE